MPNNKTTDQSKALVVGKSRTLHSSPNTSRNARSTKHRGMVSRDDRYKASANQSTAIRIFPDLEMTYPSVWISGKILKLQQSIIRKTVAVVVANQLHIT